MKEVIEEKNIVAKVITQFGKKPESKVVGKIVKYRRENGKIGYKTIGLGEGRTKQDMKDSCDVNKIVRRYSADEVFNRFVFDQDSDGICDVSQLPGYQEALNLKIEAEAQFLRLPSNIRKRFQNNPRQFVEFCTNPANLPEMYLLGLAKKAEETVTPPAAPGN